MQISQKKVKERSILFIRLKKNIPFFFQNIFIYIYISIYYIYIYIHILYIYIHIYWKKNGTFSHSFEKERNILTFFYVLCKRMVRSLRSFPFFAKEHCILFCSLEKSGKERNVLLGLISRQKLEKRTENNGTFLLKNGKEWNIPNWKECGAQPCSIHKIHRVQKTESDQYYVSLPNPQYISKITISQTQNQ